MAQYLRPASDEDISGFAPFGGPTTCWECIDGQYPVITQYIYGDANGEYAQVGLSAGDDPEVGTGHIVRWYWASIRDSTPPEKGSIYLYQGVSTIIATCASAATLPLSWTADSYTLSESEANAITDYSALQLRFYVDSVGSAERVCIAWAELEIPDAPVAGEGVPNLMLLGVG
jgi:hypothetical protein